MKSVQPVVSFSGVHDFLSNFYEAPVKLGPFTFPTNEHAFQAAKYKYAFGSEQDKRDYVERVLKAPTPGKAKYHGRCVRMDLDEWDRQKVMCMRKVVRAKFEQHPDLQQKLIQTGAAMLVEGNDWNDTFWGRCNKVGLNILGSILMEVRGFYLWKEMDEITF